MERHISLEQQFAQKTLEDSAEKKPRRVNLLVTNVEETEPIINLIIDKSGNNIYLTSAAYVIAPSKLSPKDYASSALTLQHLEQIPGIPWLLIYEPKVESDLERYAQLGKYMPAFLEEIARNTRDVPIWIFRSITEFQRDLPIVRIRYFGKLITANISSTEQLL